MESGRVVGGTELTSYKGWILALLLVVSGAVAAGGPSVPPSGGDSVYLPAGQPSMIFPPNFIALDVLVGSDGFGLGTFYRREINPDYFWFVSFSISESKDGREVERIDPFTGATFTPGKLNRFMVLPLFGGIQRRMFRNSITDSFRPFVNGGIGPVMIYEMPYSRITPSSNGGVQIEQVDFFSALSQGTSHFTFGGFVGFGANFGSEESTVFGANFRFYIIQLVGDGLPSLYNPYTGEVTGAKNSFGGFFITFHIGTGY